MPDDLEKCPGGPKNSGELLMTPNEPLPLRDLSISVGICASVALHVFTGFALLLVFVRDFDRRGIHLPPLSGNRAGVAAFVLPEKDSEFGETKGRGYAINSSPGDEILHARQAPQDQAWLSRDPVGPGKRMPDEPSFSTALPGKIGDGHERMAMAAASLALQQTETPAPFGPGKPAIAVVPMVLAKLPPVKQEVAPGEGAALPAAKPLTLAVLIPSAQSAAPAAAASSKSPAMRSVGPPGPNVSPADGAPQSESESDAFARIGSVDFKGNKVEAKLGRKFRSSKPRLNLAADVDLVSLPNPRVLLKIKIDETGKVTDVVILKSSGSNTIDLPTQVAMYKWWFEPATGKDGKPMPDVIVLTISYL